ncbi:MAG: PAQR family membrane homeostasis protein TrhA [Anaerolineales bacterium]
MFKKMREPVSGLTHFFAGVGAIAGLIALLIVGRGSVDKQISLLIYGISLLMLFFASAAYHLVPAQPKWVQVLRKVDHAAIYVLIAGTYTAFCYSYLPGAWRWGVLGVVWALALIGVIVKVFVINAPRWLNAGVYVAMGWLAALIPWEIMSSLPGGALVWLIVGGVIFTIGAGVYITKKMDFAPGVFGFHEVWHIFVILGTVSHYIGVLMYIAPAS